VLAALCWRHCAGGIVLAALCWRLLTVTVVGPSVDVIHTERANWEDMEKRGFQPPGIKSTKAHVLGPGDLFLRLCWSITREMHGTKQKWLKELTG
jgi:hypothetical protein